jgi:hypothetical protein
MKSPQFNGEKRIQLNRRSEEKSSVPVYVLTESDNGAAAVEIVKMDEPAWHRDGGGSFDEGLRGISIQQNRWKSNGNSWVLLEGASNGSSIER